MNYNETLFDFDDLVIEPAVLSDIKSRKEITTENNDGFLPLMTAPMDTVISSKNVSLFKKHGIIPILPRNEKGSLRHFEFTSYGLNEFNEIFLDSEDMNVLSDQHKIYVLIDIANGHMRELYNSAKKAKEIYGEKLVLMVGNVATPATFAEYCKIGVDYIRIGIGNGGGCLTTVQTGIGYPMASLIEECYDVKKYLNFPNVKIVADGGFQKFSDVIKGLALGADYIMLGSILNKSLESAGDTTYENEIINQFSDRAQELFNVSLPLYKTFRGMSTKDVQKEWGKEVLTTSEGVIKQHKVEYTLEGWVKNFEDYLRSAMSYTGKKELHDFIGGVEVNLITQNSFNRFKK